MDLGRLVVVDGPDVGAEFVVTDAGGTVGRGPSATVKLSDPAVSRVHCTVAAEAGRLVVIDAGGANPTRVNGRPVERAILADGDEVAVGRTRLVLVPPDGAAVVASDVAGAVTLEIGARELDAVDAAGAVLARLGARVAGAASAAAAAAAAADTLRGALGADRVGVFTADAGGRLTAIAVTPAGTFALGDGAVRRVLDDDAAMATARGDGTTFLAPLAPGLRGLIVAERRRPGWGRRELELCAAVARWSGAVLATHVDRDRVDRARASIADRAGGGVELIGRSDATARLAALVRKVGPADTTVLIVGESGVGKERVAEAIHAASPRARGPLVSVNCAALTDGLIESELFGHERGAFTGAVDRRAGRFEQADGGTLFLDEIGELSEASQAKLLRVLETRRFERLGGARTIAVDVRLVAATNRELEAMVRDGRFREDLYYRICVVRAAVPPLRERPEDVVPLAAHFVARLAPAVRRVEGLTPAACAALEAHWWPGNVRELRNVIERAIVLGDAPWIDADDLELLAGLTAPPAATPGAAAPRSLREVEKDAVVQALDAARGNKARAAQILGIDRTTLYKKLKQLGLA